MVNKVYLLIVLIALSRLQAEIHAKTIQIAIQSDLGQNEFKEMVLAYLRNEIVKQMNEPKETRIIVPASILHNLLYGYSRYGRFLY